MQNVKQNVLRAKKMLMIIVLLLIPSVCFSWPSKDGTLGNQPKTVVIDGVTFNDLGEFEELLRENAISKYLPVDKYGNTILRDVPIRDAKLSTKHLNKVREAIAIVNKNSYALDPSGCWKPSYIRRKTDTCGIDRWIGKLHRYLLKVHIELRGVRFLLASKFASRKVLTLEQRRDLKKFEADIVDITKALKTILRYTLTLPKEQQCFVKHDLAISKTFHPANFY